MKKLSEIDKNFIVNKKFERSDIVWHNVKEENNISIYGLIADDVFRRMPKEEACRISEGVAQLSMNTSGGRIRFRTNSKYIAIYTKMPDITRFPHMPQTGVTGFDIYSNGTYRKTFIPPVDIEDGYEDIYDYDTAEMRDIMINFPLYNNVSEVYVGLQEEAIIEAPIPYKQPLNVCFYGSSITHGGCVSRPGLAYPNQLSQMIGFDFVNLGFSGSAKGETAMAEYIAKINPDIFVMDYDHNAPTLEYLKETHKVFFDTFRSLRPTTPVLFVSAPNIRFENTEWEERRSVVIKTYENAKNSGDTNVYFADGKMLWGDTDWDYCAVDTIHPNDLGHYRMACYIKPIIEEIIERGM